MKEIFSSSSIVTKLLMSSIFILKSNVLSCILVIYLFLTKETMFAIFSGTASNNSFLDLLSAFEDVSATTVFGSAGAWLDDVGVEFIEVGFLDERRPFDIDRTITPNTAGLNKIFHYVHKKQAVPVAMIDFGTCSLENILPASESFVQGIRVIFKKEKIELNATLLFIINLNIK